MHAASAVLFADMQKPALEVVVGPRDSETQPPEAAGQGPALGAAGQGPAPGVAG